MKANAKFKNLNTNFWAHVRLVSERLGYSTRKKRNESEYKGKVITHSLESIKYILTKNGLNYDTKMIQLVKDYLDYRANILNNYIEPNLMMAPEASQIYLELKESLFDEFGYDYLSAMNKQKKEKKQPAFFTGIIDIITISTLLKLTGTIEYDNDPTKLVYTKNAQDELTAVLSRRFDGAYPSLINPRIIWEIKEYYYTTTFGSRIADGVYETQLDGFEINQLEEVLSHPIYHVFFTDAYDTWWIKGRSYLCRLIDALHIGLLDELIIGKEVVERWPVVLKQIVDSGS